jgi:hypothetical protein
MNSCCLLLAAAINHLESMIGKNSNWNYVLHLMNGIDEQCLYSEKLVEKADS